MSQEQSFLKEANHCINGGSRGPDVEENERRAGGSVKNKLELEQSLTIVEVSSYTGHFCFSACGHQNIHLFGPIFGKILVATKRPRKIGKCQI